MAERIIGTNDVRRSFGDVVAVDGVSFEVEKGDIFGLLGPNGAGKSTLLKLLTGQLEAMAGSCSDLGLDPLKNPIQVKKVIGIVPEVESPPSFLKGREYLHFIGLIRDIPDIKERTEMWLEFLDLKDSANVPCKDLSKGTGQKLIIAAALVHEPPLVFLDEPFICLDPRYQKLVKDYLSRYLSKGGTVFMCTHILKTAEKMCTRIAIIDRGNLRHLS